MTQQSTIPLYPLKLSPMAMEKVWGGHKLNQLFPRLPKTKGPLGEVWVLWAGLAIENGPLQGQTLASLVQQDPAAILGSHLAGQPQQAFPLLLKFIDAQETLSVQVHPDDAYAQDRENQPYGKTEFWYVLDAAPGAKIIYGTNRSTTEQEIRLALAEGKVTDYLQFVPVSTGDVILLLAGTIHALGEGIVVYELQQSSDITYRLFDWNRVPVGGVVRELHVEQSLDVADLEPKRIKKIQSVSLLEGANTQRLLCACRYFAAELLDLTEPFPQDTKMACFHIITDLQGTCRLVYGPAPGDQTLLESGDTVLIPAGLDGYEIQPIDQPCVLIKGYVPDLLEDVVHPLRARGVPWEQIVQLGGDPDESDLAELGPV
ncbi:MAG: type I phosphomannose isomerase catalytic subunit [Chloroflexota bacterium]|jgi:mannose-6-phosphate isomerase